MPSRQELVIRASAVGLDPTTIPNDSKLEQRVLYLEKFGVAYTATLGTATATTAGADVSPADTLTIGNITYTFVTALSGVKATSTLTNATSFADGETVTINGKSYTFKTALSTPSGMNQVLIGANVAASLTNLKAAINATGTAGSTWGLDTVAHSDVTATTLTGTTLVIQAKIYGTQPNGFTTTSTAATGTWTSTTLSGGVANVLNQIKIQTSAAVTLDVLKDAINGTTVTGVVGTDYSDGTQAHTQVTATTNTNTQQVVQSRTATVDNASIATTNTGSGNMVFGATTLASGVRGVVAANTSAALGIAGIAGDANVL